MSATDQTEIDILNYLYRDIVPPVVGAVYLALFTADPGEAGSYVNEVSGGSYARQLATFSAPASGVVSNNTVITFPTATANWGTVTHFAIVNTASGTGGLMLSKFPLAVARVVNNGDQFQIAIGDLVLGAA